MTDMHDTDAHDGDPAFEALAALWDRRLAEAGDALDAHEPSPKVWELISARIDHLQASQPTLTVPSSEGVWEYFAPGVLKKVLHVDADAGWQAYLVKIEPGGGVAPHSHSRLEECFVLEGEFQIGGATVRKGDLHLGFAGHDHGALVSPAGALLYIRGQIDG
ncbi:cupin domain-containing protein [Phenylobacterium montanum]|uniref:Cupin domain-containing protein n=1 Tax=Phenylobacterium montanum TaxID=2823693 RepID=A0A975G2Y6_9CAUL|nr:cupin domain-containing protein [Caulobacter sp. S6]QUD89824.1 cupin domain-containing protein [Caulobacter sp. S6]